MNILRVSLSIEYKLCNMDDSNYGINMEQNGRVLTIQYYVSLKYIERVDISLSSTHYGVPYYLKNT